MSKSEDETGYKRPPVGSRFKKGQPGNPKGRPKGTHNFKTDVRETLARPVQVTEAGRSRSISTQQAELERLREKALRGDQRRWIGSSNSLNATPRRKRPRPPKGGFPIRNQKSSPTMRPAFANR